MCVCVINIVLVLNRIPNVDGMDYLMTHTENRIWEQQLFVCLHACMHAYIHTHICTHMYMCVCVCVCIQMKSEFCMFS